MFAFACSTPLEQFKCERNADCRSEDRPDGLCEPTSFCSFADFSCEGEERRYGSGAGELSNECVGDDAPDASIGAPRIDASTVDSPDASTPPPPDAKPGTPDATVADAAPTCANISMTVIDDHEANDKLKIRVGDVDIHVCQGTAMPPGMDTVTQCEFCVDIGTEVRLSWYEGQDRITAFTSDCQSPCPIVGAVTCEFTLTEACSATATFDIEYPGP
jgi:hypothetical protein